MNTSQSIGHTISLTRRTLGRSPVFNRPLYGWTVRCSCGWEQKVNERKRYAESIGRDHAKAAAR